MLATDPAQLGVLGQRPTVLSRYINQSIYQSINQSINQVSAAALHSGLIICLNHPIRKSPQGRKGLGTKGLNEKALGPKMQFCLDTSIHKSISP